MNVNYLNERPTSLFDGPFNIHHSCLHRCFESCSEFFETKRSRSTENPHEYLASDVYIFLITTASQRIERELINIFERTICGNLVQCFFNRSHTPSTT